MTVHPIRDRVERDAAQARADDLRATVERIHVAYAGHDRAIAVACAGYAFELEQLEAAIRVFDA